MPSLPHVEQAQCLQGEVAPSAEAVPKHSTGTPSTPGPHHSWHHLNARLRGVSTPSGTALQANAALTVGMPCQATSCWSEVRRRRQGIEVWHSSRGGRNHGQRECMQGIMRQEADPIMLDTTRWHWKLLVHAAITWPLRRHLLRTDSTWRCHLYSSILIASRGSVFTFTFILIYRSTFIAAT